MPGGPPPPRRRKPLAEQADGDVWLQAVGFPGFVAVVASGAWGATEAAPVWKQLSLAGALVVLGAVAAAFAVPAWRELARRG